MTEYGTIRSLDSLEILHYKLSPIANIFCRHSNVYDKVLLCGWCSVAGIEPPTRAMDPGPVSYAATPEDYWKNKAERLEIQLKGAEERAKVFRGQAHFWQDRYQKACSLLTGFPPKV